MPSYAIDPREAALTEAFLDLVDTVRKLSQDRSEPVDPAISRARSGVAEVAVLLAPNLPCPDNEVDHVLRKVLQSGSLPILQALVEGPDAEAWQQGLDRSVKDFSGSSSPQSYLPFASADPEFLVYAWNKGFRHQWITSALARRFLAEDSDTLDPLLEAIYARWPHPVIASMREDRTPLQLMAKTGGLRHLRTLEKLIRSGANETLVALKSHAKERLRYRDWESLALLLWVGLDLSHHAPDQSPALAELFDLSKSAHGLVKLRSLEPDLESLARRPDAAPRFGISSEDAQDGLCLPPGQY